METQQLHKLDPVCFCTKIEKMFHVCVLPYEGGQGGHLRVLGDYAGHDQALYDQVVAGGDGESSGECMHAGATGEEGNRGI